MQKLKQSMGRYERHRKVGNSMIAYQKNVSEYKNSRLFSPGTLSYYRSPNSSNKPIKTQNLQRLNNVYLK